MAVTSALVDSTERVGASGTTSTVTGTTWGTAGTGRVLIDAYIKADFTNPITSGSIGGISGVVTDGGVSALGLISAVVAAGTSGNVVSTQGASDQLYSEFVVALTGAASATPTDTIVNTSGGSGNIDVPAGGCVVAYAIAGGSGTWTGATGVGTHVGVGGATYSVATFDNAGGALTNRAISYSTGVGLVVAAFDAGGGGGGSFSVAADGGTYSITGTAVTLRQKP
ncbi:MAG TPA: hypothetical protein VJ323_03555, partial [Bryobacteraceae bacterium]|nr:hypothetical protein [Bryobacteraceae bacterium]